jgi:hypothetical protein
MNNKSPVLLINNDIWKSDSSIGFLTPTAFSPHESADSLYVYGGVRDTYGRSCIRAVVLTENGPSPFDQICFDRRGSGDFDTDGTILGHVYQSQDVIRMLYVGFRKFDDVKFRAFSGLAESLDGGETFLFKRQILKYLPNKIFGPFAQDIVACHWANLDENGSGEALISVGTGWVRIHSKTFPSYTSYLVKLTQYEFESLICSVPQESSIYRLGRPRFLAGKEFKLAVLTGGKITGDYRPYFFEYHDNQFIPSDNKSFPILPGQSDFCTRQVSYPEFINHPKLGNLVLFNGDNMGSVGCLAVKLSI